jgi:hypothetical protein
MEYYYRLLDLDVKTVEAALESTFAILAFARKFTNTANNSLVQDLNNLNAI